MTQDDLKALMEYVRNEEMCVQPEDQNYSCINCEICYIAFAERVRKEMNL